MWNMNRELRPLDEFDKNIMQRVFENPGGSVRDYLTPLLLQLSEPAGRNRMRELELRGLVTLKKTKREVLVWPTEALKIMFAGQRATVQAAMSEKLSSGVST
jgi:hypothetical protein